jgi:hypothetical protein
MEFCAELLWSSPYWHSAHRISFEVQQFESLNQYDQVLAMDSILWSIMRQRNCPWFISPWLISSTGISLIYKEYLHWIYCNICIFPPPLHYLVIFVEGKIKNCRNLCCGATSFLCDSGSGKSFMRLLMLRIMLSKNNALKVLEVPCSSVAP